MKKGIILFVFLSLHSTVHAQVTIKERVEIQPGENFRPSSAAAPSTITLNLQWDNLTVGGFVYLPQSPCKGVDPVSEADGSITINIDSAQAGVYNFRIEGTKVEYQIVNFTYQLLFNGNVVRSGSQAITTRYSSSGSWNGFNITYTPPLISNYSLRVMPDYENLCYEWEVSADITTGNSCATGISWNPSTELITVSISEGSEYASFYYCTRYEYYETYDFLGDHVTVTKSDYDNHIVFKHDKLFEGEETKTVIILAEWGGVMKAETVTIYPRSRYSIRASITEGNDTLYNGEEVSFRLSGSVNASCIYCMPIEAKYTAQIIKGGQYGDLIYYGVGIVEKGDSISGIEQFSEGGPCGNGYLRFLADGNIPEKADSVIIRISTSDPLMPYLDKVVIIKPVPVKVTIIPNKIAPGDTAVILIQKKNMDGSLEDCPPEQPFEVGLLEGCTLGHIYGCSPFRVDSGACYTGTYMWGVSQSKPIYFIADSSADSGDIEVQVGYIENWEYYLSLAKVAFPDTIRILEKNFEDVNKDLRAIEKADNIEKSKSDAFNIKETMQSCSISEFDAYHKAIDYLTIAKPEIEIIYPLDDSPDEFITSEPRMPVVKCKARLNNYTMGLVKFEWEYWVGNNYLRRDRDGIRLCSRESKLKFIGESSGYSDEEIVWEVPFILTTLDSVCIIAPQPERPSNPRYGGDCEELITRSTFINDGFEVFTGGYVYVKVTAKDQKDHIIAIADVNANRIRGLNPLPSNIISSAQSNEIHAILLQESTTDLLQFTNDNRWPYGETGWPLWGYPNGYGLMQLDNPPPREDQLWNWRRNLQGGQQIYESGVLYFEDYFIDRELSIDTEEFKINTFHYYNTGRHYYLWDARENSWIINEERRGEYGPTVYATYLTLIND